MFAMKEVCGGYIREEGKVGEEQRDKKTERGIGEERGKIRERRDGK